MPDRYDRSVRVSQSTIDRIKKMGMEDAMKAANAGTESAEFVEGAKRMYGGNRVKAMNTENLSRRQEEAKTNPLARRAPSVDGESGKKPSENRPPPPSQAAVGRRLGGGEKKISSTKKKQTPMEKFGTWLAETNERSNVPLPWNRPKEKQDTAFNRMGITNKDKNKKPKKPSAWEQANRK